MTNTSIAIIYFAFLVITLVFFLITYTGSNRKRPVAKAYLFIAVMMLCWEACEIFYCLTQNAVLARYLYDLKIPFVTLAATSTLPFTLYFYRLDRHLNKTTYILIYLIPAITTLFALTSPLHNLLRQELIITTNPLLHLEHNVRGIWFWIHSAQVYLTVLGVLILIIRQHYKAPRSMRAASNFLLFGMTLTLVLSMVSVSNIITAPFDITLIGMCVALIFLYIGTAMSERAGFLSLARDAVSASISAVSASLLTKALFFVTLPMMKMLPFFSPSSPRIWLSLKWNTDLAPSSMQRSKPPVSGVSSTMAPRVVSAFSIFEKLVMCSICIVDSHILAARFRSAMVPSGYKTRTISVI